MKRVSLCVLACVWSLSAIAGSDGWTFASPRASATPEHAYNSNAGGEGTGGLAIETGAGEQWIGCWETYER